MSIERDPDTGRFLKSTPDTGETSITAILQESEQRKAALDADAGKTPEQIETERQAAAEDTARKEREAQEAANTGKDTTATDFLGDFVADSSRTPRKDKKAEAEKKAAEEAKKAEEDKKKKDAADEAARRAKPRTSDTLTAEQIAVATAEAVARVMKPAAERKQEEPPDPNAGLPPEEQRKLIVLAHMEKLYPDKYKDVADKYRAGQKKLDEYASKWEKDHPGEQFDEAADEHVKFMSENNVDWLDEDYTEAIADMRADQKLADQQKKSTDKMSALELRINRQDKLAAVAPVIAKEQALARKKFWSDLGKDFDIVDDKGAVNTEKLNAMHAKDPVSTAYRIAAARDLDSEIAELYKLLPDDEHKIDGRGIVDYNPKNPIHVAMAAFCDEMEQHLAGKRVEDKTDADGRVFLPAEAYYKLPKEKRDDHWTLTARDIAYHRARKIAKETEDIIAAEETKLKNFAKARGYTPPPDAENGEGEPEEDRTEDTTEKPHSPSLGGESRLAAARNKAGTGAGTGGKSFFSDF